MIDIPFDQYQRYKTTEIIVNALKEYHKLKNIKIIEVGANEHKNLEKFLSNDDIYYLDINIPKHLEDDPKYILGDATNLVNINDNEYDMVVALDVYEHIPESKREKFITELDRISKYGVMICAPFDYAYVEESEIRANEYYKAITGEEFIWLKEHINEKLPNLKDTNNIIENNLENHFFNFGHGDIYLWEKLIKCHFYASRFINLTDYRKLIDKLYNENIFICDVSKKNYRTFIMYSDNINAIEFVKTKINTLFSNRYKNEDIILLNELLSDLISINNLNAINTINKISIDEDKEYDLVYYIKEKDQGEYSEENKITNKIEQSKVNSKVNLEIYSLGNEIRIDPISCNCIISIEDIYTIKENKRVDLNIKNTNCDIKFEDKYLFNTNDPQIYIELENINIDNIFFNYTLIDYDNNNINEIISILSKYKLNKEESIENLSIALKEKEESIENLSIALKEKEESIENLSIALKEKEESIENLSRVLKEKEKSIKNNNIEIKNIANEFEIIKNKLDNIENSRSWKVVKRIKKILGR